MTIERSNIENIMWRKKVDNSLFAHKTTLIPIAYVKQWKLKQYFPGKKEFVSINFQKKEYEGYITATQPKDRPNEAHRLWISDNLLEELKKVYSMSHIRYLEFLMRKQKNTKSSKAMQEIENETPFWEFLDIEFVESEKEFLFVTHYKQVPSFPELFKNLVSSPKLKQIEDSLFGNSGYKIHNQDWKERSNLSTELGARNVVYTLLDDKNKLIYIGETSQDLIKRLNDKEFYKQIIPNWTHYRYEALPESIDSRGRVAIEKMMIRSFAAVLKNDINKLNISISEYKLVNRK